MQFLIVTTYRYRSSTWQILIKNYYLRAHVYKIVIDLKTDFILAIIKFNYYINFVVGQCHLKMVLITAYQVQVSP